MCTARSSAQKTRSSSCRKVGDAGRSDDGDDDNDDNDDDDGDNHHHHNHRTHRALANDHVIARLWLRAYVCAEDLSDL